MFKSAGAAVVGGFLVAVNVSASEDSGTPNYLLLYPQSSVEVGAKICRKVSNVTSDTQVYVPLGTAWSTFIKGGYPTVSISPCGK